MTDAFLYPKPHPAGKCGPGGKHYYSYDVTYNGRVVVQDSYDPEFDLARVLWPIGVRGVIKVMDGKTGKPRTEVHVGKARHYRTSDRASGGLSFTKWKPYDRTSSQ